MSDIKDNEWKMIRRGLYATARKRARTKGRDFTISVDDITMPEDGLCPILGVELKKHRGKMERHTPSLDRIDQNQGYVPGNVRVISWWSNYLKSEMTQEQVERLLAYIKGDL